MGRAAKGNRRRREFWRKLLEEQPGSGLSVVEFCRRRRVSKQAFYAWRRKLTPDAATPQREGSPPTPPCVPSFAEVPATLLERPPANRPADASITIHLPGEVRVELTGAVDRHALREALLAVREASC